MGTKPLPNSWEKWELSLLEPPNLLKHVGKEEQKSPAREATKSPRRGTFNLDNLIKEAQKRENDLAVEKLSQVRPHGSTASSVACSETQNDATEESKQIVFSDIEKALCSPSTSRHGLQVSPRSSTASREASVAQKSTSKERLKKEKAREQLSSLKKIVTDKTLSQVSSEKPLIQEPKQRLSQDKKISSSGRHPTEAKHVVPKQSPKQNTQASPKPKISVDGPQKSGLSSQQVGKKTSVTDNGGKAAGEESEEEHKQQQTWKEKALALCAKQRKQDVSKSE